MVTSAKKNTKAKQETTSTSNIKKLIGLIDQLEEHIIRRHKFPYGLPSAYAEHYKAYLPEQMEPISEEITENDRKWFYEQLDQGLLKESPEQKTLRQQAWRLPPPLLRGESEIYIYIPEEDRLERHYNEIAIEIRKFKNLVSTKIRIFKKTEQEAEKHFKEAFSLYSKHYDCSFYVYTLPKEIYKQIRKSQLARNSHKQSQRVKKTYLSIVQRFIKSNQKAYSSMKMVLGAIEEQAISKIPEYLTQEYNAEIEHCLRKKEEAEYFLFAARNDLSTAEVKEIEKYGKKTVIIQAQNRNQPLTSFAGHPIERYEEIRVFYQKKISDLEAQKSKIRDFDQRLKLLNGAKSWLKKSEPNLYDALNNLIEKKGRKL
ncbi:MULTISPECIES: prohead core protein [Acinetobacter calcoaceticus/baumannii complex]|uniref:Prohead core protein n=1 Tax=Acinetobacter pittii TaxID=48296 RepID=A0A6H0FXQ7_ACIPI|nr:prohead core protein [Acinetobacter pittii]QIT19106.1 prohead core protein [Acinetobacter pittii]